MNATDQIRTKKYVSGIEVCEYFGISKTTFHLLKRQGIIKGKKLGKKNLYILSQIEKNMTND